MKKILSIILFLVFTIQVQAQNCATCNGATSLSLTTGLNTSGTLITANGIIDPYWQLINVAPPSVNGSGGILIPNAYTIQSGSSVGFTNWCDITGAKSLSVIPNFTFPTNNSVASQPWRFVRKFYLCQSAQVHFVVDHIGDDIDTVKIFNSNGALLYSNTGLGWGTIKHFDVTLPMNAGCCYMTVELANIGASLMGFSVKANLTTTGTFLSNPNPVCCGTSIISGQKIIDANCDGKVNPGELPGVGWTFNLMNGSTLVQSAITDGNGEFTFYNVANGTYSLQEVPQSGYFASSPSTGQFTVVVSTVNSVQTFQFLNCQNPPCLCSQFDIFTSKPFFTTNGVKIDSVACGGTIPKPLECNRLYSFDINFTETGILTAACRGGDSIVLKNGSGTVLASVPNHPLNYTFTTGGNYCVTHYLIKNGVVCRSCSMCFNVVCSQPTPCTCAGDVTINQGQVNVITQTNIGNLNPVSTATTSFTLIATQPISEIRVLIDEFRITTSTGNENCILCRNKPQTWANINTGNLTGVILQPLVSPATFPPTLEKDIRELVFNNGAGSFFNLSGNTLNLTLGVPGVTGLNCCTLKAEVCIKFIIRDVNCCEKEILKCFSFNLQ